MIEQGGMKTAHAILIDTRLRLLRLGMSTASLHESLVLMLRKVEWCFTIIVYRTHERKVPPSRSCGRHGQLTKGGFTSCLLTWRVVFYFVQRLWAWTTALVYSCGKVRLPGNKVGSVDYWRLTATVPFLFVWC